MRIPNGIGAIATICAVSLTAAGAQAQSATALTALRGLAPVSALGTTEPGKAALAANLAVTTAIQTGTADQPTLLPFPEQQQLALRDAFITQGNATELADGLGSRLGAIYQAGAAYSSPDGGKTTHFTNISPAIAALITYAQATSRVDSDAGKYFFANATTDGSQPVAPAATTILEEVSGVTDIFGRAYGLPAGSPGAGRFGNSRPFQTAPHFLAYTGQDYFGTLSGNVAYLRGPAQNLSNSPSYPSGHTTYGYTESLLLALLVPQRYQQMVTRGAEYGNNRIIIGAHYAMDVLGGRTLALHDVAHLLANAAGYVGVPRGSVQIDDFRKALDTARADLVTALEAGCGGSIESCARQDDSRFAQAERNQIFYDSTQTYGLPVVFARTAAAPADVGELAPEAGYLLTAAFPHLTLAQANAILTETQGPGGGFLDNGSGFGVYSRLDLVRAARKAAATP
ncbi:Phosphatase PAP2 family protein [Rhodovastum atsumiense]|uniref:Phosphatase PAP2 family protein n=1 Tax=Rhodovastum atsumiense TaxID=504468 RepID=A0A5M6IWP6_9PROT|nr:phosphatase PAP2 family protein [Rhodovastum atsumiense]KAA5612754.1 phosphatase PAP2 family protein [Rhodovastum atsumiense]CAH2602683.1 Phosphatase PAP2 family protein [Rhodovastum atsumiense]